MAFKVGGDKGAAKRTYSSRGLGGVSSVSRTEGATRSSVNPMDEMGDRDSYEGSGTGYRKTLHDQLEALQATDTLRAALEIVLEKLKTHARTIGQVRDVHQKRYHQQEFAATLDDLSTLTQPELWEGTAVMRLFSGRAHLLVFPRDLEITDFSPKALGLHRLDWTDHQTVAKTIDRIDMALENLERMAAEVRSIRKITDSAMASMPHGQPARIQQTQTINTIEFATKTAQWVRSAMLANGGKAIEVQASRLSLQALHLVG